MVKIFEHALEKYGTDKEKAFFSNVNHHEHLDVDDIAYKKVKIIIRAINTDEKTGKVWLPNWLNGNQRKYCVSFMMKRNKENKDEINLSFSYYGNRATNAIVGCHLGVESPEKALYAAHFFSSEFKEFITPTLLNKIK